MAVSEKVFVAQPVPLAGGRIVAAPFQFYTTGEDRLRIVSVNSLTGVVLSIHSRMVDSAGTIQANAERHVPRTDRTVQTSEHELGIGALLNLTVFASTGAPLVGQTFVIVQLIRGAGAAAIVLGTLLQGYVTSTQQLSWPGSPMISSTEGEPFVRAVAGTAPAAGVEISETVPTGARWSLISLLAGMTTGGAGADRRAILQHVSSGTPRAESITSAGVPLGSSANISWGVGLSPQQDTTGVHFTAGWMTDNRLLAGDLLRTTTNNFVAGDQWTAPFYMVREWLEVP